MPVLYKDREEAGRKLLGIYDGPRHEVSVLGIARGGVPVGYPLAKGLSAPLDVVTVRKLPIPWSPEAGFGAIAPDGSLVLNPELVPRLGLSQEEIDEIAKSVLTEVRRRERAYREEGGTTRIKGRNVVLVDDGLASGFTMIAAIKMTRAAEATSVTVAVPVSPVDSAKRVEPLADGFICDHISRRYPFAVASFYEDFHDLTDEEVLGYLVKARGDADPEGT